MKSSPYVLFGWKYSCIAIAYTTQQQTSLRLLLWQGTAFDLMPSRPNIIAENIRRYTSDNVGIIANITVR